MNPKVLFPTEYDLNPPSSRWTFGLNITTDFVYILCVHIRFYFQGWDLPVKVEFDVFDFSF